MISGLLLKELVLMAQTRKVSVGPPAFAKAATAQAGYGGPTDTNGRVA